MQPAFGGGRYRGRDMHLGGARDVQGAAAFGLNVFAIVLVVVAAATIPSRSRAPVGHPSQVRRTVPGPTSPANGHLLPGLDRGGSVDAIERRFDIKPDNGPKKKKKM